MFRNNRITGPLVIIALTALLALSGSDCAVVVKSGSSSDDKDREDPTVVIGIASGTLVDAPVEGVQYESGSIRGVTAADGGFRYETGARVRFHIGDIPLGQPVAGKSVVTPVDLVAGEGLDSPAVINLGRLLQSLDAVPGDDRITIPAVVRDRALATNPALTGVIEHLDYADETRFVNAASQLLAVLTDGYPHTVVLVDASQARLHLERALSRAGVPVGNR
jgi:hypothetical protein